MGSIRFNPTFQHTDWVDVRDAVRAREPNGFNARFTAIENDLVSFATVVDQIDTAIDDVVNTPTSQVHLWLPPAFVGGSGWNLTSSGAAQAAAGSSPSGAINLVLPNAVRLVSLRAIGQTTSVPVALLFRRARVDSGAQEDLMPQLQATGNPFDVNGTVNVGALTDIQNFRYFIRGSCIGTPTAPVFLGALMIAFEIV